MVCMTRFATPSPVEQKNHTIWAEWKTDIVFDRYKNSPLSLIGRDGSSAWLPYTSSVDVKGSHHTGPTVLRYSTKTPSLQCDDDDVGLAVLICRADIWRTRNNALLAAPLTHGCGKPPLPPPPHLSCSLGALHRAVCNPYRDIPQAWDQCEQSTVLCTLKE